MNSSSGAPLQGSVMIVGAGIAGIQATLDLPDSGFLVYLVESYPLIFDPLIKRTNSHPLILIPISEDEKRLRKT